MRIMIDTNIFISAALFPKGRAAEALYKSLVIVRNEEAAMPGCRMLLMSIDVKTA